MLLRQLGVLQEALWRHAVLGGTPATVPDGAGAPDTSTLRSDPNTDGAPDAAVPVGAGGAAAEGSGRRKYHRSEKPRVARYWRTHEDPFEGVWGEIVILFEAVPERTG